MVSRLPVIDEDDEVGDLSEIDPALFQPFSVLPTALQMRLQRRFETETLSEECVTIHLSLDVLQTFRATGDGWQTRINEALKEWLSTHSPA